MHLNILPKARKSVDGRNISRLFERFETLGQGHSAFSTGIGLSLVHELVTIMHGTIEVTTALGKGSEFVVSLPIKYEAYRKDKNVEFILNDGKQEVKVPGIVPLETPEGNEKDATLLVVEDNEELRALIVRILQHTYRVLEAKNGREGLELAISEIPDVIISDVMMPEMDGIELLNEVKHHRDICHVPVIILSAKASLEDRIKGLEYGADGYITKPFLFRKSPVMMKIL